MTLLLDAEARLFVVPEKEAPAVRAARIRAARPAPARQTELALPAPPAARAEAHAPAAPAPAAPAAPRAAASAPAAPAPAASQTAAPAPAAVPDPATWAAEHGRGGTLDELLTETWEGLATVAAAVACPVCDGELVRRWSAGAGVVGGRCGDCGSELS
jgi:hypothetical protein